MNAPPDLSVIIVSHGHEHMLRRCVTSLVAALEALSEGETYRGGLILTEIGFVGAQSKTLGLWTRVFRAPTAWSTPRDSMRATKVLRDVIAFELSYYGSWDATSPPKWRNEWIGS